MKLIKTENTSYDNVITESYYENTSDGKRLYLAGPFLMGEVKNRNGRVYTTDVLDLMVDDYRREYMNSNQAMGEINHPDYPKYDISKVAIQTTELNKNGNNYDGKAVVLDNMYGQVLKSLADVGFPLGVSSRAVGKVTINNGIQYVNKGIKMNAIDAVNEPSGQICYPNMILESTDWVYKNGEYIIEESERNHQVKLNNVLDRLIEKIKG